MSARARAGVGLVGEGYLSQVGLDKGLGRPSFRGGRRCVMVAPMLQRPTREQSLADRILHLLRLYSSNWTGTVGRGDVIIPQREMAHLVRDLLSLFKQAQELPGEASEAEIFQTLMESQRLPSIQDRVSALRRRFLIMERSTGGA